MMRVYSSDPESAEWVSDLAQALQIPYMIGGSMASGIHGIYRIPIWWWPAAKKPVR
jgi:hypothetical protein